MLWEMSSVLKGWKALTLLFGFEERMFAVAESSGEGVPCTLEDDMYPFIWGNPVYLQSKVFIEYMQLAKEEMGLLQTIDLPCTGDDDTFQSNIIRKGVLRADGVI